VNEDNPALPLAALHWKRAPARKPSVPPVERGLTAFVERSLDGEQDANVQDLWAKVVVRKWIVVFCVLTTTLLSLAITQLTPITWQASTKILIRYGASESVFLKGLIPDGRVTLSGAASSEILRSRPTIEEVVDKFDVQDSDLYKPITKVLTGRLSDWYHALFPSADDKTPEMKREEIATQFQESLKATSASAGSSKVAPIEILAPTTPIPQSVKGDELITLTVKAFNRTKIADMANGLTQAFIDQYYLLSAQEARRSIDFLSSLENRLAAELQQLEKSRDKPASANSPKVTDSGGDRSLDRHSPMITALSNDLATREIRLAQTRISYGEGSAEFRRQKEEIDSIRAIVDVQERVDLLKSSLEQIRERQFQAQNIERMYQNHLVPISIVEPAVTPPPSKSAPIVRLLVSALTGILIGLVIGLSAALALAMLDQRLFSFGDVERALRLPIFGWTPNFPRLARGKGRLPDFSSSTLHEAADALAGLVGGLRAEGNREVTPVIAITSSSDNDGKSFVSLLLAKVVALENEFKVLLIDADPVRASLSDYCPPGGESVPQDKSLNDTELLRSVVRVGEPAIDVLPQPRGLNKSSIQYTNWLRRSVEQAQGRYNLIIVDTPSMRLIGRTLACCQQADMVLLVVRCGFSRKGSVRKFLRAMDDMALAPDGVILNRIKTEA
jgi:Mrp family chromosome partitioning ATPase/capsular polysaccharide biosynthesis protein